MPIFHGTIHNRQVIESALVPINGWINKENVVYIPKERLFVHEEGQNHVICKENEWIWRSS
jgi:hypothetical protein